jgi:hypothetical protein
MPSEPRAFPWVRVLLGLVLVGGALVLLLWPRGQQLEIEWRLTEDVADFTREVPAISRAPAGGSALLRIRIKPGPDAPEGAHLVCSGDSRPRVLVSPHEDLVFERPTGAAHDEKDEIPLRFRAAADAAPGPREVELYVEAELAVKGKPLRPAVLRRRISVQVGTPIPGEKEGGE